jgi:hypothetical protein
MLSDLEQRRVWEGLLGAETRSQYFADLCGRYQRKQKYLTWGILLLSSGAFAAFVTHWASQTVPWLPAVLALSTAGLSLFSLVAKNERNSIDCNELHFKQNTLAREFEDLWDDMYSDLAATKLKELEVRAIEYSRTATSFPNRAAVMLKWENHVILRRCRIAEE